MADGTLPTSSNVPSKPLCLHGQTAAIRGTSLFRGLDAAKSRLLAAISEQLSFEPGESVFDIGDPPDAAYLITEGEVGFVKACAPDEVKLTLGPGKFFGEVGILTDTPRRIGARAVTPLRVLRLNRDCFLRMMRDNPDMSIAIAQDIAKRMIWLADKFGEQMEH